MIHKASSNRQLLCLVQEFLCYCKTECGLSSHTLQAYQTDLNQFCSLGCFYGFVASLQAFSSWINNQPFSAKTKLRKWSTLRHFYRFCSNEGACSEELLQHFPAIKSVQHLPSKITLKNVEKLLQLPDQSTPMGLRDYVILECLYSTGIRVSECIKLKLQDIDFDGNTLKVMGKGSKQRMIPLTSTLKTVLLEYVNQCSSRQVWLFQSKNGTHLTRQTIFGIVKKYALALSTSVTNWSPHAFRHAFATHLIEGGARLRDTQLLLGHQQLASTQIYTKLSNQYIKTMYNQAHPRATL